MHINSFGKFCVTHLHMVQVHLDHKYVSTSHFFCILFSTQQNETAHRFREHDVMLVWMRTSSNTIPM